MRTKDQYREKTAAVPEKRMNHLKIRNWNKNLPMMWIQRDSSGFTKVTADEDTPLGAVYWRHRDGFVTRVRPVKVVLEPVQSETYRGLQGWVHQRHLLGRVIGLVDEGAVREGRRAKTSFWRWGFTASQPLLQSQCEVGGVLTTWWALFCDNEHVYNTLLNTEP